MLRDFFASRHPLSFDIARVAQWESGSRAVYGVPEPEQALRSTMRALWELFPEFPPYGGADDPPPHASLTLVGGRRDAGRRRGAPRRDPARALRRRTRPC